MAILYIFVLYILARKYDEILSVKLRVIAYHDKVSANVQESKIAEDAFIIEKKKCSNMS